MGNHSPSAVFSLSVISERKCYMLYLMSGVSDTGYNPPKELYGCFPISICEALYALFCALHMSSYMSSLHYLDHARLPQPYLYYARRTHHTRTAAGLREQLQNTSQKAAILHSLSLSRSPLLYALLSTTRR